MANIISPSNPDSYVWSEVRHEFWIPASDDFQAFYRRWYTNQTTGAEPEAPYTIDLSPPLTLLSETNGRLVVRKSYQVLLQELCQVAQRCKDWRGGLILGDCGIGKSMFLWYALVCLLKQKHAVLFHWRRTTYLFYLGEVYQPKYQDHPDWCPSAINGQIIWSLLDVDMEATEPHSKLTVNSWSLFPIQASSHSRTRYKYWERRACPEKYGMPLWDKQELLLGLKAQTQFTAFHDAVQRLLDPQTRSAAEDPTVQGAAERAVCALRRLLPDPQQASMDTNIELLIEDAMESWGADPCSVYRGLLDPVQAQAELDYALQLLSPSNIVDTLQAFRRQEEFPIEGLHALVAMQVTPRAGTVGHNNFNIYETIDFTLDFKSPRIGVAAMEVLQKQSRETINYLFRQCAKRWTSFPLARWFNI